MFVRVSVLDCCISGFQWIDNVCSNKAWEQHDEIVHHLWCNVDVYSNGLPCLQNSHHHLLPAGSNTRYNSNILVS